MKKILKHFFKKIDSNYPSIGSLIWKIHHRKLFSINRQNVKGNDNVVGHRGAKLSSVIFDIEGNGNRIDIKEGCILNKVTFYIRGNNHRISIEKNCRFNRGGNIWLEDSECSLVVGEGSTFEDVHLALTEPRSKITIGCGCMFAYDIDVRTGDSHSIILESTNERINYARDVSFGDHVWVAAHCIILKGVRIPENSVVATGSVVTHSYETKGTLIAGNPAKQIKEGITWSRERF